ncbi:MAG: MBOAT family protein [Myxococcales bacterium]|jgi:alginate O-acetyltransferase complex protein AlgI|nr:MBOAT family protein [Myxococcales bacterium]
MQFNSQEYFIFLGIALTIFWLLRNYEAPRLRLLFVSSCLFYMAWNPKYIVLLLASTFYDYFIGNAIHASDDERVRKRWVTVSIVGNLAFLGVFKYFNFASRSIGDLFGLFGVHFQAPYLDVLLPVGISFYTFQTMSYTIDIYRRKIEPAKTFREYAVFVTYFPALVAGPIVRASELLPQLAEKPRLTPERVSEGVFLILTGLVKKIVVADYLSVNLVDRVFDNPELYTATEVVIALYGFTAQIYADFSGYTDMARGSAMLMGYDLPENFDRPYQAPNPAEFWRRWHMTLSRWLRDYLYFPLGGSRSGPVRAYFNLWITFFLIGVWHGASWTFVIYGALQATVIVIHRFVVRSSKRPRDAKDPFAVLALKVFLSMQFVVFSRILFRANDISNAREVTERLFSGTSSMAQIAPTVWAVLIGFFILHYTPRAWYERLRDTFKALPAPAQGLAAAGTAGVLAQIATTQVVPYIYFQF